MCLTIEKYLQEMIIQYFRNPKLATIYFYLNSMGSLCPSFTFPTVVRSKSCYFVRVNPTKISRENYDEVISTKIIENI